MSTPANPSYHHGEDAQRGGLDITISLTPEETAALGVTASDLADWFDTALWALAMLRTGTNHRHPEQAAMTAGDLYTAINDLDARLLKRLEGIRDAAVRSQADLGGTLGDLALAMNVAKSTAQSRRKAIKQAKPSFWETWARGDFDTRKDIPVQLGDN